MSVRLAIDIDGAEPLRGRVQLDGGAWTDWVGWVSLAVLVGGAAEEADGAAPPVSPPPPPDAA